MERYTREEIEAFVLSNLQIVGEHTHAEEASMRTSFSDAIDRLPPHQQTILIESRRLNVTGDYEEIQKLYSQNNGKKSAVNGFFRPGQFEGQEKLSGYFNTKSKTDAIVWHKEARGEHGTVTARHEQGHREDYLVGGEKYWSSNHAGWREAVAQHMEQHRIEVSQDQIKSPLTWIQKQISEFTSKGKKAVLYDGARDMDLHLSLYDREESHILEAFAEISNHYLSLYAHHNGNETKVGQVLSRKYPELWGLYRDEFLPAAKKYAADLRANRDEAVDKYVRIKEQIAALAGRPFHHEATVKEARIFSAQGLIHNEIYPAQQDLEVWKDPVAAYIRSKELLAQDKWDLQYEYDQDRRDNPFIFDPKLAKAEAKTILEQQGVSALVARRNQFKEERKQLKGYERISIANEEAMSHALDVTVNYPSGPDILSRFETLMEQGGVEAVQQARVKLRVPTRAIIHYIRARERLEEERWDLQYEYGQDRRDNPFAFDTDRVRADIEAMQGPDMKDKLEAAAQNLREQSKTLRRFEAFLTRHDNKIATAFNTDVQERTTASTLEAFDQLYHAGGAEAVNAEMQRQNLPPKALIAYARARERWEEQRWDVLYDNEDFAVRNANAFSFDIEASIRDAEAMMGPDAEAQLTAQTELYKQETRALRKFSSQQNLIVDRAAHKSGNMPEYRQGADLLTEFDSGFDERQAVRKAEDAAPTPQEPEQQTSTAAFAVAAEQHNASQPSTAAALLQKTRKFGLGLFRKK